MANPDELVIRSTDVQPFELETGARLRLLDGDQYAFGSFSLVISEYPPGTGADLTHSHPHVSAIVVVEGRGLFTVGEDTVAAEVGDIVVVSPDALHSFRNDGDVPLRVVGVHDSSHHSIELPT